MELVAHVNLKHGKLLYYFPFQHICSPLKNISNSTKNHCNQGGKKKRGHLQEIYI